jgi:hypothetical protein
MPHRHLSVGSSVHFRIFCCGSERYGLRLGWRSGPGLEATARGVGPLEVSCGRSLLDSCPQLPHPNCSRRCCFHPVLSVGRFINQNSEWPSFPFVLFFWFWGDRTADVTRVFHTGLSMVHPVAGFTQPPIVLLSESPSDATGGGLLPDPPAATVPASSAASEAIAVMAEEAATAPPTATVVVTVGEGASSPPLLGLSLGAGGFLE